MIKIKIWGDITSKTSNIVESAVSSLIDEQESIIVILNSNGGTLNDAVVICNLLKNLPNPLITVAMGNCISAATLIFNCGKERYITKDTEYMLHQPFLLVSDTINLYKITKYQKDLSKSLSIFKKYYHNVNIPKEKLDLAFKYGEDLILNYTECIKYNIATNIFKNWSDLFKNEHISINDEKILLFEISDILIKEE